MDTDAGDVRLRPWQTNDLWLLERLLGDPAMTIHLGGPDTPAKVRRRNQEYASLAQGTGRIFAILAGPDGDAVGSVGYWLADWQGASVWEIGCSVLPEYHGRGIGTQSMRLAIAWARSDRPDRDIHAYPAVANDPSNAMCRRVGFTLAGEADYEYPRGKFIRVYDWVLAGR